jgi:hexokinase
VASAAFQKAHPLSKLPSQSDLHFVRRIARVVSHRAAAYLATAIHGLWVLKLSAEDTLPASAGRIDIGCNGSVIEHYPLFMSTCQKYINELVTLSGGQPDSVTLDIADESALYGAAVAVSCLGDK